MFMDGREYKGTGFMLDTLRSELFTRLKVKTTRLEWPVLWEEIDVASCSWRVFLGYTQPHAWLYV